MYGSQDMAEPMCSHDIFFAISHPISAAYRTKLTQQDLGSNRK